MADSYEKTAAQNLSRLQSTTLDSYSAVGDRWTKTYGADIVGEGDDATKNLARQSKFLADAESVLGSVESGSGTPPELHTQLTWRRASRKKMRAMNLLSQADDAIVYDPMAAEYVDPITGETVNAATYELLLTKRGSGRYSATSIELPEWVTPM